MDEIKALHNAAIFCDMAKDGRERLINCLSPNIRHFSKGEILLLSGDTIKNIGILLTGTADAYLEHIGGSHTIISQLKPLDIFGEVLASTRTHKSPVTIYATSNASAAFIKYTQLFNMCEAACTAHRTCMHNIVKSIGDKYFHLFDRINILREKSLRGRILSYLYTYACESTVLPTPNSVAKNREHSNEFLATDRADSKINSNSAKTVTLPFTKTTLANYLLANRSALSKELRKMEDDGIITVKGREVTIL